MRKRCKESGIEKWDRKVLLVVYDVMVALK
jgi:hypothetical protein